MTPNRLLDPVTWKGDYTPDPKGVFSFLFDKVEQQARRDAERIERLAKEFLAANPGVKMEDVVLCVTGPILNPTYEFKKKADVK